MWRALQLYWPRASSRLHRSSTPARTIGNEPRWVEMHLSSSGESSIYHSACLEAQIKHYWRKTSRCQIWRMTWMRTPKKSMQACRWQMRMQGLSGRQSRWTLPFCCPRLSLKMLIRCLKLQHGWKSRLRRLEVAKVFCKFVALYFRWSHTKVAELICC